MFRSNPIFLLGYVCATRGIHGREENCSDFPCNPFFQSFGATHFPLRKGKKNELLFLDREDFNVLC